MNKDLAHVGMATGRVWAGFLHTWTWPADLPQKPEPTPFNKRIFFCAPDTPHRAPRASLNACYKPRPEIPTKKKTPKTPILFINLDQKPKNKNPRILFFNQTRVATKNPKINTKISYFLFTLSKSQTQTQKSQTQTKFSKKKKKKKNKGNPNPNNPKGPKL